MERCRVCLPVAVEWEADVMAGMEREGMANEMDPASPNLCAEHCKYGEQGDQLRPPTVPAVSLTSLYVVPLDSTITESSELVIVSSGLLLRDLRRTPSCIAVSEFDL